MQQCALYSLTKFTKHPRVGGGGGYKYNVNTVMVACALYITKVHNVYLVVDPYR